MKRYVPNLIPARYRILPDYFKALPDTNHNSSTSISSTLWNILAIALSVVAITVFSTYPGFSLSLLLAAFFASTWGKHKLEQGLRFRFTTALKFSVLGVLILPLALTGSHYKELVDQAAGKERLATVAEQKAIAESKRREALRIDSLQFFLKQADISLQKGAFAKAVRLYSQSARFATGNEAEEQQQLHRGLATGYVRMKAYQSAINEYTELDRRSSLTSEQSYQLALCYRQVGRKSEAMSELFKASEAGYRPATKLYDKLNPILRKLLYYQTVCCDGSDSPSNAKGRGACSHHGGVCNWNKPIYQTYRKYDANGL